MRITSISCFSIVLFGCSSVDATVEETPADADFAIHAGTTILRGTAAVSLRDLLVKGGAAERMVGSHRVVVGNAITCNLSLPRCELRVTRAEAVSSGDNVGHFEGPAEDELRVRLGHRGAAPLDSWFSCSSRRCSVRRGRNVSLSLSGLTELSAGFVYEGWLIAGGAPYTAGRFNLTSETSGFEFRVPVPLANQSNTYVLTIEPGEGDDPAPSKVHVLAGDLQRGKASLTVSHPAALGNDFAQASGGYILGTPTTRDVQEDYALGIWFVDPSGPRASLSLPTLPEGWVYEGWVVGPNGPVTTGRFTSAQGMDSDGAGKAAGPDMGPPWPGQDYINPPMSLPGGRFALTIEPEPDDSAKPFPLKVLDDTIEDVGAGALQSLSNQSSGLAHGEVTLR